MLADDLLGHPAPGDLVRVRQFYNIYSDRQRNKLMRDVRGVLLLLRDDLGPSSMFSLAVHVLMPEGCVETFGIRSCDGDSIDVISSLEGCYDVR